MARSRNARPADYVQAQRWTDRDAIIETIKAAVEPMGTDSTLVATPAASDFFEYIRPRTIIGKLLGLRRAPARTRLIEATGGSTAYWSGERQVRPISKMALTGATIDPLSVVAIAVQTRELMMSSDPASDLLIRDDLARAYIAAEDSALVDPANAGVSGEKPASVFSGAAEIGSTGSTLAEIDRDLRDAVEAVSAYSDLEFAAWVMSVKTATYLASLRGSGGALAHPGMTARGGTLLGLPAIASTAITAYDSPSTSFIGLVDASSVLLVDYGAGEFSVSDRASLAMVDESVSPAPTELVSLFQVESAAIKVVHWTTWRLARSGAAAFISGCNY
jgi:HK97 family phage major capsid protein